MTERSGFTVVETLVALLLLLMVLGAAWAVAEATGRSAGVLADRAENLAAARAVGWILQEELEGVRVGSDLTAPAGDSFSVRAFRGAAFVCGQPNERELTVRWSGVRTPDPTKDSVLALSPGIGWTVRALAGRSAAPGDCPNRSGGVEERWRLTEPAPPVTLLRFFERGSYHLSDEALRYRIGAGGRQPLTPSTLDPSRSGFSASAPGRVIVTVATRGSRRGREGPAWLRAFTLPGGW